MKTIKHNINKKTDGNIRRIARIIEIDVRWKVRHRTSLPSRKLSHVITNTKDIDESCIFEKVVKFYSIKIHSSSDVIRFKGFSQPLLKVIFIESLKFYILKTIQKLSMEYFEKASFIDYRESDMQALEQKAIDIIDDYMDNMSNKKSWDALIYDIAQALELQTQELKKTRYYSEPIHCKSSRGLSRGYENIHDYDAKDYVIYPLLYATSRNQIRDADKNIVGYGVERDSLHYGKCEVKIEKSNKLGGKLNKSFLLKVWDAWMDNDDDNRKVSVASLNALSLSFFNTELEFLYTTAIEDEMLLYIHGYNNSFEDAAMRAGQIAYDLKFPGVTSFYSWASKNTFTGYGADSATSEISVKYLYEYILNIWEHSSTKKIHILSHSMGNRIFMNVLRKLKENDIDIKFGHIILVAPDVDKELFEEYSHLYGEHSEMSTLYVSSEDKAVRASYKIHQNNRVGLSPPVVVQQGIDTIHADSVIDRALWDLGHSYYAEAEALISDMHELLTSSTEAKKRQKLEKVEVLDKEYWQLSLTV